jgi:hypothetical protein
MGVIHVLTGPDHLSAIATLSVNLGNCRAFSHGVRWGIGHSIGLIVVGTIFIVLENIHPNNNSNADDSGGGDTDTDDDSNGNNSRSIQIPEKIENIAECFVGIFMLALGSYSLFNACRIRKEMLHTNGRLYHRAENANDNEQNGMRCLIIDNNDDNATNSRDYAIVNNDSNRSSGRSSSTSTSSYQSNTSISQEEGDSPFESLSVVVEGDVSEDEGDESYPIDPMGVDDEQHGTFHHSQHIHGHGHDHEHNHLLVNNTKDGISKQFLSLCIGIVHGVAGPGGVLGVIPAVRLHNVWYSIVYLGSFCITSILVMGCFAACYGTFSSRLTQSSEVFAYRMELFSSSLSIIVGCTWLSLLYLGILHDIFP